MLSDIALSAREIKERKYLENRSSVTHFSVTSLCMVDMVLFETLDSLWRDRVV